MGNSIVGLRHMSIDDGRLCIITFSLSFLPSFRQLHYTTRLCFSTASATDLCSFTTIRTLSVPLIASLPACTSRCWSIPRLRVTCAHRVRISRSSVPGLAVMLGFHDPHHEGAGHMHKDRLLTLFETDSCLKSTHLEYTFTPKVC